MTHNPARSRGTMTDRLAQRAADDADPRALQDRIAGALKRMAPVIRRISAPRLTWRVRDVLDGRGPACHTLQAAIDERIAQGCTLEQALEVATAFELYVRAQVAQRDGECGSLAAEPLTRTFARETACQGAADNAQWAAAEKESPSNLQRAAHCLAIHRGEIDRTLSVLAAKNAEASDR